MGTEASKPGDYQEPQLPEGVLEVRASVYKLKITGSSLLDEIGSGVLGAFHSGIVVAGEEWAYGGHDEDSSSGVYATEPELNSNYHFYQRVILGRIHKTKEQVKNEIINFASSPDWAGNRYDLMGHNCNHFASDLSWMLLKKRLPEWVNATADKMHRDHLVKERFANELDASFSDYRRMLQISPDAMEELPGEKAFKITFDKTFHAAWEAGWAKHKKEVAECPEDVDPEEIKHNVECTTLAFAAEAAKAAALAVASASRLAKSTHESLFQDGRPGSSAWDDAWKRASAPLLTKWREEALNGTLRPDNLEEGEHIRMKQVEAALKTAAEAAEKAAEEAKAVVAADPS